MKLKHGYFGAAMLLNLWMLVGCGDANHEQDIGAIRQVLEQRALAINTKDIDLYGSIITKEYLDGAYTRDDVVAEMARYFQLFDHIKFDYQRRPISITMNTARIIQRVTWQVSGREQPVHIQETLLLRQIQDKWYISAGISMGVF